MHFKTRYGEDCAEKLPCSTNRGPARIQSVINASKTYNDSLFNELEHQFELNPNLSVKYNKNCVSRYTSKKKLSVFQRDINHKEDDTTPSAKRLRRSATQLEFKRHCLWWGDICETIKDETHPERWRPAYMCLSTKSEQSGQPHKQYLLEKCNARGDQWEDDVSGRIQSALSDLHAEEYRYHRDCMSRFPANWTFLRQMERLPHTLQQWSSCNQIVTTIQHLMLPSDDYRDMKSVKPFKKLLASSSPFTMVKRIQPSLPSDFTMHQDVSRRLAAEKDFAFFKNILTCGDCPEYGGFNTTICREKWRAMEPKTKVVLTAHRQGSYGSFYDDDGHGEGTENLWECRTTVSRIYSWPSTLSSYTTRTMGEPNTDKQHRPEIMRNALMSYCGSVGTLMAGTGIQEILSTALGVCWKCWQERYTHRMSVHSGC